jgi:DNA-binding LacI/PurR family transcriptional regulator
MQHHWQQTDAVFAASDMMALGAMRAREMQDSASQQIAFA